MDRMDGFEVCQRLQGDENTSHIPIIVLTVLNDPDTRRQSLFVGAVDFIPKDSFMNTVLLETLRQLGVLTEQDSGDLDTK
jgi:CheY-like chemotaxis protein